MTNHERRSARGDVIPDQEAEGASAPEPSLVARVSRSTEEIPAAGRLGEQAPPDEEAGSQDAAREGDPRAPRTGRVDAAAATFGPDPERDRMTDAANGTAIDTEGATADAPDEDEPGGPGAPTR
jgi:hypothetical protein